SKTTYCLSSTYPRSPSPSSSTYTTLSRSGKFSATIPVFTPKGPRVSTWVKVLLLFHLHQAGCPSGQRELTVNQPSSTSWVQIPQDRKSTRLNSVTWTDRMPSSA